MKISIIKEKANQLLIHDKSKLIQSMIITSVLIAIPNFISSIGNLSLSFLAGIMTVLSIVLYHTFVVMGLKVARNNSESLSNDDAYVGLKRFKELFPTYLIKNLIQIGIAICVIIIFGVFFLALTVIFSIDESIFNGDFLFLFVLGIILFAFVFILLGSYIMTEGYTFATPYLLEKYHMTDMEAIRESFYLMKGHMKDYIKLELSFLGWMLLVAIIEMCLNSFVGSGVSLLIGGVTAVYLYYPQYYVSRAILFEEIAYYHYNHQQEETFDNINQEENIYGE